MPDSPAKRLSTSAAHRIPAPVFFVASSVFHSLGPAFAVLLFAAIDVLGVAWLRIASAAVVFALWRRPWRVWASATWRQRRLLMALGATLGAMNSLFYLALDRLPLGTVSAIEFLGPVVMAAIGVRTGRNLGAFLLAVGGVGLLAEVHIASEPWGLAFAFGNCLMFVLYVVVGHRIAQDGGAAGVDRLGCAMLIAGVLALPVGIGSVPTVFAAPGLLLAALGVGVCSSVIPYVCDQFAMARLPRSTFALMLSLIPATAVAFGLLVLAQVPTPREIVGIALVIAGVVVHQDRAVHD